MKITMKVYEGQKAKWQSRPGSVSVAARTPQPPFLAFFGRFEPFRGKSMEVPLQELLAHHIKFSRSSPIKPNQG
jgi:hypothetical protein